MLVRCAVLFVDLLGVREMNMSQRAAGHLVALHNAVGVMHRDFFGESSRYRSAFFSYDLESRAAVHPRIVLSRAAAESQRGTAGSSMLLCDDDGHTFIDYLGAAVSNPHDPIPALQGHRDTIVERLHGSRRHKRRWEKYRWLGEYHNAVVRSRVPKARELLIAPAAMTWQFSAFA